MLDLGKVKVLVKMSKPARLYPKEDPMDVNPRLIWIGSIIFAIVIGWIGIATATVGI